MNITSTPAAGHHLDHRPFSGLDVAEVAGLRLRPGGPRIAPSHPTVATLPHAIRTPLHPNSLGSTLKHLTDWFNHLTDAGVTSLAEVSQAHCDAYLQVISRCATDPDRRR